MMKMENNNTTNSKETKIIYQDEEFLLQENDNTLYFIYEDKTCCLSSHPYEPCLYIHKPDETIITVHDSFETGTIYNAAINSKEISTISGHSYDLNGICRLLKFACETDEDSFDITYLEGRMFIDILQRNIAFSSETAIDLEPYGLKNHNIMNRFTHSKRIGRNTDGAYYLIKPY